MAARIHSAVTDPEQSRRDRAALRKEHGPLFDAISAALFRENPMGIGRHAPTNEYDPEVGSILPRLKECRSADDVAVVVQEEMTLWFAGAKQPRPVERYAKVAVEIWQLWSAR